MTPTTTIIIAPPPTPNGDLHIGHMAGPYLAGDVYARYLRARGRPVIYTTGTDDSQTYVVATAHKRGMTPEALCAKASGDIQNSLAAMGVAVDGFAPFDDGYRQAVLDFLRPLHAAGKFRERTVRLPYLESTGEYLMEGLVGGDCPVCLADSRDGCCETCGHPNNFDQLIDPHSTMYADAPVTYREATILVLPLEEYRDRLEAYYATRAKHWRPHIRQLAREVLVRPLPDFPITYPTAWGIPAPFPQTPGQVINAWAEGMAASMYCTWFAAREPAAATDEHWRAEHAAKLVYFLGFDNAYFWGMTHLALLMAHGDRYIEPDTIVCNEFYELENEKFSTSRGHVIWTPDLLAEVPRDLVRFYLALTCPEHARTNFSRAALDKVTRTRLVEPWNRLAAELDRRAATGPLPVSDAGRRAAAVLVERFAACYELPTYSLYRAADAIAYQVERLARRAAHDAGGDLLLSVRTLLACAAPLLVDVAEAARAAGVDLSIGDGAAAVTEIAPFRLTTLTAPVRDLVGVAS